MQHVPMHDSSSAMCLFSETRDATLEDISWLRRSIRRHLSALMITDELVNDIQLVIAELATNCLSHPAKAPTQIKLTVELVGAHLRIEICDDGTPFADFEAAWNAAGQRPLAATAPTGLGLTLAKSLLSQLEYFPGNPNRMVGLRSLAYRRPAVLLVEDEPCVLQAFASVLRDRYRVYTADSIGSALAIAATRQLDMLITDFHLETEPATRLLAELERDAQRLPIPVIVLSADPADETRERVQSFAVEQFLEKPITAARLRQSVDLALKTSRRRMTGMFRHFGASVDNLLVAPAAADLAALGLAACSGAAAFGNGDFILLLKGSGRQRIVLADVMGHGLQAAAGSIALAATLRSAHALGTAEEALSAGGYLSAVSQAMAMDELLASLIVTVIVVDLVNDGSLEIASAGHPRPTAIGAHGARSLSIDGPLLGMARGQYYRSLVHRLDKGERIALVTDGVDPVHIAGGGTLPAGLVSVVQSTLAQPLDVAISAVEAWAAAELGPSPRDDWTIMLLEMPPT